jgi:transposase
MERTGVSWKPVWNLLEDAFALLLANAQPLMSIDFLDAQLAQVSAEIEDRLDPFARQLAMLESIPGLAQTGAEIMLAEIGPDLPRFPTAGHLASWAGRCPGTHESGGKRSSGKTRKGSPWLKATLVEAAVAAGRPHGTHIAARFSRLAARRGRKRAAVAIAHPIRVVAHHLLSTDQLYDDTVRGVAAEHQRIREEQRLIRQLERMGNSVTVERSVA